MITRTRSKVSQGGTRRKVKTRIVKPKLQLKSGRSVGSSRTTASVARKGTTSGSRTTTSRASSTGRQATTRTKLTSSRAKPKAKAKRSLKSPAKSASPTKRSRASNGKARVQAKGKAKTKAKAKVRTLPKAKAKAKANPKTKVRAKAKTSPASKARATSRDTVKVAVKTHRPETGDTAFRNGHAVKVNREWPSPARLKPGSPVEAELVQKHIPLVRTVVGRVAMTLPPHVDGEDLYSAGLMGLLNAVRQYDPRAGTSFETYARLRIRGAVLDELRRMDWVPRSVHTKARKVQGVMQEIEQKNGRAATEEEMAQALNISVDEYQQWLEEIRPATFVCLDASHNQDSDDSNSQYECFADSRQENPVDGAFRQEVSALIAERIKKLPEMQQKVLALYYFEDLRLREIAETFGLTESRICQIHSQAILSIKSYLQRVDAYFA